MKLQTLAELEAARFERRALARTVRLPDGEERVLDGEGPGDLEQAVKRSLRQDRAEAVSLEGERWLVQPFNPPLRLIIIGAVHIAQPLARMARMAGYEVTVVDPRTAFARHERFPGIEVRDDWPDEALQSLGPDGRTAVVTLTHDPKLDDPALDVALRSPAFYVGCLGSRRTHASRLHRLSKKGFDSPSLERIFGPVGLPIGARSPAEIAVSILAQMTEVLRKESE